MRLTRVLITAAVLALLVLLVAREVRRWSHFDWSVFAQHTRSIDVPLAIAGFALVIFAFVIRAARWKLLLRPHSTTTRRLLPPTLIGFTAIALLGRAGEFVRPYLIARNEEVSISSQIGVWTVERIFDLAAFALLLVYAFASGAGLQSLPYLPELRRAGAIVIIVVVALAIAALLVHRHGGTFTESLARPFRSIAPRTAERIAHTSEAFRHGVRSLGDPVALAGAAMLSLGMWVVIALSYIAITHAFPAPLSDLSFPAIVILIGFSIAGGLVQLPGASTSQLIVIAALVDVFRIPSELAVSCGILLWLCAYMAPVPFGLILLRKRHLSLRGLSQASRASDAQPASV